MQWGGQHVLPSSTSSHAKGLPRVCIDHNQMGLLARPKQWDIGLDPRSLVVKIEACRHGVVALEPISPIAAQVRECTKLLPFTDGAMRPFQL